VDTSLVLFLLSDDDDDSDDDGIDNDDDDDDDGCVYEDQSMSMYQYNCHNTGNTLAQQRKQTYQCRVHMRGSTHINVSLLDLSEVNCARIFSTEL